MLKQINFIELEVFLSSFKYNKEHSSNNNYSSVINNLMNDERLEIDEIIVQIEEIIYTYPFPWLYVKKLTGFEFNKKIYYIGCLLEITKALRENGKKIHKIQ